ncbi:Hypothetical predicted protein [Prunus dulcis]|uniref:Uncharacterized protein n=1 Tax=Prunus dulcis TaxID=3755 RepID=A0A5E4F841_PRUDU|nr:Hypothetical predicted protein [Prunus dulcis]
MDVMAGLRWKDSCCGLSSEKSGLSHIFEVRIEANVIHTRGEEVVCQGCILQFVISASEGMLPSRLHESSL